MGFSSGHYICDVKAKTSNLWYRTNDKTLPLEINTDSVSTQGYAILLRRIHDQLNTIDLINRKGVFQDTPCIFVGVLTQL